MRLVSAVVGFALAIALVGPAPTVQAASSDELASVELQGLRVAAVGYWPAPIDEWRCGSYLYSYSGVAPTSEFLVELIDAVSEKAGVSKADADRTIQAFFDLVVASAKKGDKVSWPGFGSFSTSSRKARVGRNPQTGEAVQIAASTAMKFSPSSTLKAELNPNRK